MLTTTNKRTDKETRTAVIELRKFNGFEQAYVINTVIYDGVATTYLYPITGFDDLGNWTYDPKRRILLGKTNTGNVKSGHAQNLDRFVFNEEATEKLKNL